MAAKDVFVKRGTRENGREKRGWDLGWAPFYSIFIWGMDGRRSKVSERTKNLKKRSFSGRKGAGLAKVFYFSNVTEEKRLARGESLSKKRLCRKRRGTQKRRAKNVLQSIVKGYLFSELFWGWMVLCSAISLRSCTQGTVRIIVEKKGEGKGREAEARNHVSTERNTKEEDKREQKETAAVRERKTIHTFG